MDKLNSALISALKSYSKSGVYPMHMPGHKRNGDLLGGDLPWRLDITEIPGFDNLHKPRGILSECQKRAAELWNSENAFYLTCGSTSGILAGIYALTGGGGGGGRGGGGEILLARNCHKSVYHATQLCGLVPRFITPPVIEPYGFFGSITPERVKDALAEYGDIKLAVITSPTYEGVISDISDIAELLHCRNIPLLVDEAHGAHLGLSGKFPKGAIESGADIVIHSLHKTLPSLTQTAMCHIQGRYITPERMQHAISVFQTSSPSYPLMSSIDSCVGLFEKSGKNLMSQWKSRLESFYYKTSGLKYLRVLNPRSGYPGIFSHDPGKIIISSAGTGYTGTMLMNHLLKTSQIQLEMAAGEYAIAMTSPCDTEEGLDRLASALFEVDSACFPSTSASDITAITPYPEPRQLKPPSEAINSKGDFMAFRLSNGQISGEYVWAYPPGIPIITPGQAITTQLIEMISGMLNKDISINSTYDKFPHEIRTVAE